ncbi:MAG TPA: rhomboid family intramembrane serine protease [Bacillota bacterium]|nr:MAG: Rhomboid protease GluP [Firmicutes bacterium ADurb.Bin153]HNV33983.1 rhomboid family intramembrane serine protease [Bacillota bacterium]
MSFNDGENGGKDRYKLIRFPRSNSPLNYLKSPTISILVLNVLAFIMLEIFGGSEDLNTLVVAGAKVNILVQHGQWWRLFTAMFLHYGLLHIALNSYSLYNLGTFAERIYGGWRFVVMYITSGLAGNLLSTMFGQPYVVGVGASGAIFGIAGSILYLGVRRPELFKYIIGSRFITAIAINLVISFTIPGIDAWAHIGGLAGGFAIAWALGTPADDMYGGPAWWKGAIVFGALGLMLAYILA